jgi:hypothetical protein
MKVGDLVTLSSYGRKLKMYSNVVDNDVGLIVKESGYAFCIRWQQSDNRYAYRHRVVRKDIKYAKKTFSNR